MSSNEELNPLAGYMAWLGLTMALAIGGIFLPASESKWLFESAFAVNLSGTVLSPAMYFASHRSGHKLRVVLITLGIAFLMGVFILLAARASWSPGY